MAVTSPPAGYLVIAGELVVVGKEPDGDSVRFRPDRGELFAQLEHGDRVRLSGDGTVQLRFDGVDAPELHYQGRAQPLGDTSRGALLAHLGFTELAYAGTAVTDARPLTLPAVVLSRLVEVNGRPVALVLTGEPAVGLKPQAGVRVELTPDLLASTQNLWLLTSGQAYPLAYTSTAAPVTVQLRNAAEQARSAGLGVWAVDATARFPVTDQAALGPSGALVLPKLFRRATDYLRAPGGLTLPQWLAARPDEDDLVLVAGQGPVALHTLLEQRGREVTLLADPLDLVFVER